MPSKIRRPPLSPEDEALWENFKKQITPLRSPAKAPTARPDPMVQPAKRSQHLSIPQPVAARNARLMPGEVDRAARRNLARGNITLDDRLDLHGLTQALAHRRLFIFLQAAQARNARYVIIITGKGTGENDERQRGVLRRAVPLWLRETEFRALVSAVSPAAPQHGGEGALYVRLRRLRPSARG